MISQLLNNLHPAINKDPQSVPALTINGTGTAIIKDDVLQIIGSTSARFSLRGYTLDSLATDISGVSGFSASNLVMTGIGAAALLDGTYTLPASIPMFTSFLWQILKPVALALVDALGAEGQSLMEMILTTSEGAWLDSFGELFGIVRETGEPDVLYAIRIFNLSVGPRVNNIAIRKALHEIQYESDIDDDTGSATPAFNVNITMPTNAPEGFVYSTAQMRDIIDQIRPAGVTYQILSQGSNNDSGSIQDSYTTITTTNVIKYGVRKWGQMIWA